MIRWLDGLGPLKWPSLLLVLSPVAAYPFWQPGAAPAERCGQVLIEGRAFDVYRGASAGEAILRPVSVTPRSIAEADLGEPIRFDAGGMVVSDANLTGSCASPRDQAANP